MRINFLAEKLKGLSISNGALACYIHVPDSQVSQILAGKRTITADTALSLGKCLNTEPDYRLNLKARYELEQAEYLADDEIVNINPLYTSQREAN